MSDGVWKYAGWERIRREAVSLEGAALVESLKQAARLRSGSFPDDFTLIVLESGDRLAGG